MIITGFLSTGLLLSIGLSYEVDSEQVSQFTDIAAAIAGIVIGLKINRQSEKS